MDRVRKYKIIKKLLIPILALAIFLLPVNPSLNLNKDGHLAVGVKTNEAEAVETTIVTIVPKDTSATIEIKVAGQISNDTDYNLAILLIDSDVLPDINNLPEEGLTVKENLSETGVKNSDIITKEFKDLTPGHKYLAQVAITEKTSAFWNLFLNAIPSLIIPVQLYNYFFGSDSEITFRATKIFTTNTDANSNNGIVEETVNTTPPYSLGCNLIGTGKGMNFLQGVIGCVAGLFYIIWEVSAMIGHLAGSFLDWLVYYSTNSDSYKNGFITEGWKAIRDVANIFFIVALLYIAIKTILSLNVTNNKKIIGTIIIIALLINFSLFFTQVIIDGSNILAKVFYNNIDQKYNNGTPAIGAEGEKSISIGLVDKFNPQEIITTKLEYIKSQGTFIFITLLAIAITLYAAYIFFTVGLLFVSRVVMLWLSMIFAPIAFASYTLPFDIPGLGHKDWWKELLQNAFLAPIFIFMLYIIVMFAGFLSTIVKYPTGASLTQILMSRVIPFVILMVLLMKAKEMAVKYAGEMGKVIQTAGKFAGGVALGAATGGLAMAGRQTIGRATANISQSNKFRDWAARNGKFGKLAAKTMGGVGSASFDARGIKVMGKDLGSTGLKVGKNVKTGGFAKGREEKVKREEEYTKKSLDTSDYGLAKLTGQKNMSEKKKEKIIKQMNGNFGMSKDGTKLNEQAFRAELQGGLKPKRARDVADQLSSTRRGNRSDGLVNSPFSTMTDKISATKIRKDPEDLAKIRAQALALAEIGKQLKGDHKEPKKGGDEHKEPSKDGGSKPEPTAPATTPTEPTAPAGGGGGHSGH